MWISCPHIGMGKLPCTHPVGSKFTSSIDIFYEPFAKSTFGVGVQCLWLLRTRCFHYRWLLSLAKDCRAHVAWLTRGLQCKMRCVGIPFYLLARLNRISSYLKKNKNDYYLELFKMTIKGMLTLVIHDHDHHFLRSLIDWELSGGPTSFYKFTESRSGHGCACQKMNEKATRNPKCPKPENDWWSIMIFCDERTQIGCLSWKWGDHVKINNFYFNTT